MSMISVAASRPAIGPIERGATLGVDSQQVLPFDALRRGVIFHNPGAVNVRLAAGNIAASTGAGSMLIEPESEFSIFADDINGLINISTPWNACSESGSGNPLTIFNFTDNNSGIIQSSNPSLATSTSHPTIGSPLGS
jgi:hypothetical protein